MIWGPMKRGVQMIHGHEWKTMVTPLIYWKIDLLMFWHHREIEDIISTSSKKFYASWE